MSTAHNVHYSILLTILIEARTLDISLVNYTERDSKNNMNEQFEEKMFDINCDINEIGSLARILLEIMRNGENLKYYDTENLAITLNSKIKETKEKFNSLERELQI